MPSIEEGDGVDRVKDKAGTVHGLYGSLTGDLKRPGKGMGYRSFRRGNLHVPEGTVFAGVKSVSGVGPGGLAFHTGLIELQKITVSPFRT